MIKAYSNPEYNEEYNRMVDQYGLDRFCYWGHGNIEDVEAEDKWYNISEPIPMTEDDIFHIQQGNIGGVYHWWTPDNFPKYWVVRRGQYHLESSWDYMDLLAIKEDGTIMDSQVCRFTTANGVITERRYTNLVNKLLVEHDILKIKKSYL